MATPTVTNVKRLSNFFFDLVYTDTKKLTIDHFTVFGDYIDIFKLYFKRCVYVCSWMLRLDSQRKVFYPLSYI